jgi:hypothetical protein
MLYQKIGFAEFRWDYFAYGSDASARLCEVWNKPKQSLGGQEVNFSITYDRLPNFLFCTFSLELYLEYLSLEKSSEYHQKS